MRKVHYAGGYLMTGDRLCKALLRYARALARNDQADIVTIPIIDENGEPGYGHLLIGPASQLFSIPVQTNLNDPEDSAAIESMEQKTRELQPHRPVWSAEMQDIPEFDLDAL